MFLEDQFVPVIRLYSDCDEFFGSFLYFCYCVFFLFDLFGDGVFQVVGFDSHHFMHFFLIFECVFELIVFIVGVFYFVVVVCLHEFYFY